MLGKGERKELREVVIGRKREERDMRCSVRCVTNDSQMGKVDKGVTEGREDKAKGKAGLDLGSSVVQVRGLQRNMGLE